MFIPKKIKSGYNEREDTYTGKLAYIIYYDEKNKLRKEVSWNSWRKEELGEDDYDNVPTEGFVLNRKVGGTSWSSWNTRNTYTRVYDPRGFEFEISIPNLLFILENTNSIKGKGLEGDFVYGWEGKELWLIPVDAVEYSEWNATSKLILSNTTIKAKDLVVGYTYMTKQEAEWIYLGRFIEYDNYRQEGKPNQKKHWFTNITQTEGYTGKNERSWNKNYYENFSSLGTDRITSIPQKIIYCLSEEVHIEYPEIMEALEHNREFIGLEEHTEVKKYLYDDLMKEIESIEVHRWGSSNVCLHSSSSSEFHIRKSKEEEGTFEKYTIEKRSDYWNREETVLATYTSIKDLFDNGDCNYKNYYLTNGKIHRTSRTYDINLKDIMEEENE